MALNVSFLKGTQSNLDKLQSYQAGSFYLTTDTDRLYFAQSDSELVYLNKYITTVETQKQLPDIATANTGDFYYVTTGNILCTKASDSASKYTQINPPDTNTETETTGLTFAAESKDGNIIISYTLDQSSFDRNNSDDETKLDQLTGSFTIKGSDIGSVVTNVALDIDASVADNVATVVLDGTGVDGQADGIKIKGGTNVTLASNTDHEIIVNAVDTTYNFASAANSTDITLTNNDQDVETVSILGGGNNTSLSVTGTNANEIVIAHADYATNTSNTGIGVQKVEHGGTFDIISGILYDNGHITEVKTNKVTLPSISDVVADDEGNIKITVVSADQDEATVTSSQSTLYYTVDDVPVYNQAELTDYFYTKDDINNALKSANAMTFKGTVGTAGTAGAALPTQDVKIGDTYLVVGSEPVTGSSIVGTKGDMFIASGEETDEGVLDSIIWIHVPAGDEVDTTYQFSFVKDQGLKIHDNVTADDVFLTIGGGTAINVTTEGSLNISHADVARKDSDTADGGELTVDGSDTFTVVTSVNSDSQGHITGIDTTQYKMPKIDYKLGFNATDKSVELLNADSDVVGSINVTAGENIVVTAAAPAADNTAGGNFVIEHGTNSITVDNTKKATFSADNTVSLVTNVTGDDYGHLSAVEVTEFTFPDTTYTYEGSIAVANNTATITAGIYDADNDPSGEYSFNIASESLAVSIEDNTSIKLELAWGSF